MFSGWQWAAAITALNLPDLTLILPKIYFITRPALFGLVSLGIAAGLFTGHPGAPRAAQWMIMAMILWTLVERGILSPSEYAARSIVGIALISLVIWSLLRIALHRPIVRNYFQENHV